MWMWFCVYERRYDSPRNLDRPGDVGEAGEMVVDVVGRLVGVVVNILVFNEASPADSSNSTGTYGKVLQRVLV
jgi:hypothetical protein